MEGTANEKDGCSQWAIENTISMSLCFFVSQLFGGILFLLSFHLNRTPLHLFFFSSLFPPFSSLSPPPHLQITGEMYLGSGVGRMQVKLKF